MYEKHWLQCVEGEKFVDLSSFYETVAGDTSNGGSFIHVTEGGSNEQTASHHQQTCFFEKAVSLSMEASKISRMDIHASYRNRAHPPERLTFHKTFPHFYG